MKLAYLNDLPTIASFHGGLLKHWPTPTLHAITIIQNMYNGDFYQATDNAVQQIVTNAKDITLSTSKSKVV